MFTASWQEVERKRAKHRENWTKRAYGITNEQVEQRKLSQRGLCPVCELPLETGDPKNRPVVDHIKGTTVVRAILHNRCNLVIGHAHEDPALLRRAADYIEKYR